MRLSKSRPILFQSEEIRIRENNKVEAESVDVRVSLAASPTPQPISLVDGHNGGSKTGLRVNNVIMNWCNPGGDITPHRRENHLFIKTEKCEFHASTLMFLGHIIAQGQVRMDPEKVRTVLDWPKPESSKQLQRFLGFANFYGRFIINYSRVAAPLTALPPPTGPFLWTSEGEGAFSKLKKRFTSAPILTQPNSSRQPPEDNKLPPCAFLSHRLSPIEKNYDVGNRELLADKAGSQGVETLAEGRKAVVHGLDRL